MHRVETAANTATAPVYKPSSSRQTCTWPVSGTFARPGGGTMAVSGETTGSLNTTGSGSAQAQIAAIPASRSLNGMILKRGSSGERRGRDERLERHARVAGDRLRDRRRVLRTASVWNLSVESDLRRGCEPQLQGERNGVWPIRKRQWLRFISAGQSRARLGFGAPRDADDEAHHDQNDPCP
jgi:hypothetical protein